jgi:arylsulfate sulfotransferase
MQRDPLNQTRKASRLTAVSGLRSVRWWAVILMVLSLGGPWSSMHVGAAAPSVTLKTGGAAGQPVGSTITWVASATGMKSPVYQFSVTAGSGPAAIARDYSKRASFKWTPMHEGAYTITATVEDGFGATASSRQTVTYTVTSRVKGGTPVVSATANPLVALFSAPACSGSLTVQFRSAAGTGAWQSMAARPCVAGQSVNVLVAGLMANTKYVFQDVVAKKTSAQVSFTTGKPDPKLDITKFTVGQAPTAQSDQSLPLIFHSLNPSPKPSLANPVATDLSGNVIWYYDTLHAGLTAIWPVHIVDGGTVLLLGKDPYRKFGDDVLREVDLAGDPLRETNLDAVNAQLKTLGEESIYEFHHDALRLPNGDTATLGATQKKVDGHNVMSDMVLVLDKNFQVVWAWDVFDHLTPPKTFPKGTPTCIITGPLLCGLPDTKSIDWTHGNSLAWSPADQDLIVGFRNLSAALKIDFKNGEGEGKVIWHMGLGGDFKAISSDKFPWFTQQHNVNYSGANSIVVFDDGNMRCQFGKVKGCDSRGQVWKLDEKNHTATLTLNADLGAFWQALGSAQGLPNGNITFAGGYPGPSKTPVPSSEIEFTPSGTKVFELNTKVAEYRAYRFSLASE